MKYEVQYKRFALVKKGDLCSCRVYLQMVEAYRYYLDLKKNYQDTHPEEVQWISQRYYIRKTAKKFGMSDSYMYNNIASLMAIGEGRMRELEIRATNVLK